MSMRSNAEMSAGCDAIATKLFAELRLEFNSLVASLEIHPHPQVAISLTFDPQPGLQFRVILTLQGDEFGLGIGDAFWSEWYPCDDDEVVSRFRRAVRGVLTGEFRILETRLKGNPIKARLQQPTQSGWETIATWLRPHLPSFRPSETRTLQNTR